jgi:feruloyl-CoA synthase
VHWAEAAPNRTFMARRVRNADGSTGEWRHITYAQALDAARRIGQALIDRKLSAERPVAILSENDLEHALLALGCLYAGVPFCPVSPAYSTISQDYDKLRHVLDTLTPGLVFASDGARYGKAIAATVPAATEVVLTGGEVAGREAHSFASLLATQPTPAVDAAMRATGPDTITKFLFTSGSTKLPKAVINTHRMWCANQQQMRQSMPVLAEDPPVLVDWLPWNHTFGGNHNFGLTVYNGGTLYIDDGKPTPALMAETLRNLREIAPTVYFNVPTGFEAIAHAMKTDDALRRNLLSRVKMFFYAGAALAQPVWDALHESQEREVGERIVMGTGLGMTESSPFAIFITNPHVKAGYLGVPTPGLELKLVPCDGKTEVRYKGPNITPGYWRNEAATQESFDDEGFFCTGDAVLWIDENDVHQGLKFDGRIAEDFKLATGTFVSVGPMRAKIIAAGAPYVQDAVLTGINLKEVGALVFPTPAVRKLAGLPADAPLKDVLESAPVQAHFQNVVNELAANATGSANRIARLHLMHEPASIDKGEVTDKGSINQRAVLKHREALAAALHDGTLPFTIQPSGKAA